MSAPFVTSVRVENGAAHDYVTVWIRGANVGTLVVGQGDGEALRALLLGKHLTPWMTGALEAMRPHEPDDEVFASTACAICGDVKGGRSDHICKHWEPGKGYVRDATDAEQLAALNASATERGDLPLSAGLRNRLLARKP